MSVSHKRITSRGMPIFYLFVVVWLIVSPMLSATLNALYFLSNKEDNIDGVLTIAVDKFMG